MSEALKRPGHAVSGSADTTGLLILPKLKIFFPEAKFLFILRDAQEVKIDLATVGFDPEGVDQLAEVLTSAIVDTELDSAAMRYEDIYSSAMMHQVWDFLELPGDFPWRRFELLRTLEIESKALLDPHAVEATALLMDGMATFERLLINTFPQPAKEEIRVNGNT